MPAIRLKRAAPGPTDVGVPNTNATRLELLVNGGLADINLAANFPVMIAAAASSLPDRAGRVGVVAAGGHYIRLVHDGDKYASQAFRLFRQQEAHTLTSTLLTPTATAGVKFPSLLIPGYKALYDAGLRAQVQVAAQLLAASGTTADLYAVFFDIDADDTALGDDVGSAHAFDPPGPGGYRIGDWTTLTEAPTRAHAIVVPSLVGATGEGIADGQALMRWIYEP